VRSWIQSPVLRRWGIEKEEAAGRDHVRTEAGAGVMWLRSRVEEAGWALAGAWEEARLVHTLLSDLWPPEQRVNKPMLF
jgi:hypothetical protein